MEADSQNNKLCKLGGDVQPLQIMSTIAVVKSKGRFLLVQRAEKLQEETGIEVNGPIGEGSPTGTLAQLEKALSL